MAVAPDFTTATTRVADFTSPTFNLKPLTIEILGEQSDNLNIAVFNVYRSIAAAIIGPKKCTLLGTMAASGYTVYTNKRMARYLLLLCQRTFLRKNLARL